ncbi:MAG: Ig-like domain-containing protein [Clostridiales bacterium]|nr:Ig-like domain-containing protein [Clostridiales bacterium]
MKIPLFPKKAVLSSSHVRRLCVAVLFVLLFLSGFSASGNTAAAEGSADTSGSTASTIASQVKTLKVGKTWKISGYAEVSSSKSSVAKAVKASKNTYKITAKKKGQTVLTLYNSDGEEVKRVYLLVTNSGSFKYNTASVSLMAGRAKTVKATVQSGCSVKYSSSDTDVATVSASGRIRAIASGKATITARVFYKGKCVKTWKKKVTVTTDLSSSTLKTLLLTALEPVGSTMYVWGGGWNKADTGAGIEAVSIGVTSKWKAFFKKQTNSYNYQNTRYQIHNGLDCSGYIGWCIYNILNTTDGNAGYVMSASKMASNFASRGWGTYRPASSVKNYRAGDIMSSSGHVWMVVGQCGDGSVVLLHSSPPGVRLCGTPSSSGKTSSQAVKLAASYMKQYFPEWYKKYPSCSVSASYLSGYSQMRWNISGKSIMTDPDGYRNMSAGEILKDLFASK